MNSWRTPLIGELANLVVHCPLHMKQWKRLRLAVQQHEFDEIKEAVEADGLVFQAMIMGVPLVVE